MSTRWLLALATGLSVLLAAPTILAQSKVEKVGNMYKWKDKDGNVHFSDQIPPDAAGYAREKFNEQGVAVQQVDRALTPEEQKAKDDAERKAAEEAKAAEARRKADEALLNSYASEDDLTRAYNQRMDLLAQTIDARKVEIGAREQSLSKLVAQAADMERGGRAVSDTLKQMITAERAEIDRQKKFLVEKEAEKSVAKTDYERDVAKYREALARAQRKSQ